MSDLDPIAELQDRLARLEANLTFVRTGKAPAQPVDLLAWRANGSALAGQAANTNHAGAWSLFRHTLRGDWRGMSEAIRNWAIRVEERFGR